MEKKYWVPALEKSDAILRAVAEQPGKRRLIDLSKQLSIHKSSMFSLLATMEALEWVVHEADGTYSLGASLGVLGRSYFQQFGLIDQFRKEAAVTKHVIAETIQLARLERNEVLYLAKEEMPSPVRLTSEPGMRLPAHITALGKVMLAFLEPNALLELYPDEELVAGPTPHSLQTRSALLAQLDTIRRNGYAYDLQEAVIGFCCVAAPVRDANGYPVAAISCSMFQHQWEQKKEHAQQQICAMANKLSQHASVL